MVLGYWEAPPPATALSTPERVTLGAAPTSTTIDSLWNVGKRKRNSLGPPVRIVRRKATKDRIRCFYEPFERDHRVCLSHDRPLPLCALHHRFPLPTGHLWILRCCLRILTDDLNRRWLSRSEVKTTSSSKASSRWLARYV